MQKTLRYLELFYMLDEKERELIKERCKDIWKKHSKEEAIKILGEVRKRIEENLM
jgi:hypothetical protein